LWDCLLSDNYFIISLVLTPLCVLWAHFSKFSLFIVKLRLFVLIVRNFPETTRQLPRKPKFWHYSLLNLHSIFKFRQNGKDKGNKLEQGKGKPLGDLPTEVVGLKKSRGRLMEWFKRRVREQQDCAICLDRFKKGETLVHLPCAHKFHSICLLPWLDTNVYCPYCRTDIWN